MLLSSGGHEKNYLQSSHLAVLSSYCQWCTLFTSLSWIKTLMSVGNRRKKNIFGLFAKQWKPNCLSGLYTGNVLTTESPLLESKAILLIYFCHKRNAVYLKSE